MRPPTPLPGPEFEVLFSLFPEAIPAPQFEQVAPAQVPQPYHGLLVHEEHMTVTVEDYYHSLVDVRVLYKVHQADSYARMILLALKNSGQIVQFGIVRINLNYCDEAVRRDILAQQLPLGRILIEHDVMRRIVPTAFLRVTPHDPFMMWFALSRPEPTYGRLGFIYCDDQPAIELLEILAPVLDSPRS